MPLIACISGGMRLTLREVHRFADALRGRLEQTREVLGVRADPLGAAHRTHLGHVGRGFEAR